MTHKNRIYKFIGTPESTVGSGHATYDSIMLSSALSETEKTVFDSKASESKFKDRFWINDIEFVVDVTYQ